MPLGASLAVGPAALGWHIAGRVLQCTIQWRPYVAHGFGKVQLY